VQSSVRPSVVESIPTLSDMQDIDSYGSSWSQQPVEHVLVATDLTQRSDRAIERSLELADLLRAQLTLLHVVDEDCPGGSSNIGAEKRERCCTSTFGSSCPQTSVATCQSMFARVTFSLRSQGKQSSLAATRSFSACLDSTP
jgi:hypothetical protein